MLITTCTHCLARFRVTPGQLNAKQGQVRCGKCSKIFSGFEALERFPDDDTGARLLAAREAADKGMEPPAEPERLPEADLPEVETIDAPPSAPPPSFVEEPAAPSAPLPSFVEEPAAPSAPPAPARAPSRRRRYAEVELTAPERRPLSRAWSFGVVLLVLVLGAEAAYGFRGSLAQRYPVLRPWLESVCAYAGCNVPWKRDERLLKLEDSELLEVPGRANEIALGARIRNLAPVAQEYPHLELTLTDLTGQAAARRVLRPIDYIGRALATGEVLAPGAEVAVQLRLETPRIKATGYELLLFYP
jgi:predicted Zn finger-like uncharacterized protein